MTPKKPTTCEWCGHSAYSACPAATKRPPYGMDEHEEGPEWDMDRLPKVNTDRWKKRS